MFEKLPKEECDISKTPKRVKMIYIFISFMLYLIPAIIIGLCYAGVIVEKVFLVYYLCATIILMTMLVNIVTYCCSDKL